MQPVIPYKVRGNSELDLEYSAGNWLNTGRQREGWKGPDKLQDLTAHSYMVDEVAWILAEIIIIIFLK